MKKRLSIAAAITSYRSPIERAGKRKGERKFKAHLIGEDGKTKPIAARAIFVDMGDGRDLLINLYERDKGDGISVMSFYAEDESGTRIFGGRIAISVVGSDRIFISVKK